MSNDQVLDLTFPGTEFGSHQTPWDLQVYLYQGAASMPIYGAIQAINKGDLNTFLQERLPLIEALHAVLIARLASGARKSSVQTTLYAIKNFYSWADKYSQPLTIECAKPSFIAWVENLIFDYQIKKSIKHKTAYHRAALMADLLARALPKEAHLIRPGSALLNLTRIRSPKRRRTVEHPLSDKQNLEQTFAFGRFLADICSGLDVATIRGPLPVTLTLRNGSKLFFKCELKYAHRSLQDIPDKYHRRDAARLREPLSHGESIFTPNRKPLLHMRIEAELMIFIAQTGMNLSQAHLLRREDYRWRTEGEEVEVFRVYKDRRGGDAIFRAFREYRQHLKAYIAWLEQTGLTLCDDRLFPRLVSKSRIRAEDALPQFLAIRNACRQVSLRYIGPRELRKTRINWLVRRSRDADLTATLSAHAKETLIRDYERPHHQSAVAEITHFHLKHDPAFHPPGPGLCIQSERQPHPISRLPPDAPKPDCANPDGCLFCTHHRDEMSLDYCWQLASARHLKVLELTLWRSPKSQPIHPANRVIDRINAKFKAISSLGRTQAEWVHEVVARIREGAFHPSYSAFIELAEMLL